MCCPTQPTNPQAKLRISAQKCSEYSKQVISEKGIGSQLRPDKRQVFEVSQCKYKSVGLIVGGNVTKAGEFPHSVS